MGNICSKSANTDNQFSTPGRVLGSSSQSQPSSAPVPQKITTSMPGRVVGGAGAGAGAGAGGDDPRSAAARAAEERAAKASQPTGKLSSQLQAQKRQTQNQVLNSASEQERQARVADANTEARNYN